MSERLSRRHFLKTLGITVASISTAPRWATLDAYGRLQGGNVIEVFLEARETVIEWVPGVRTRAFAFNDSVPGPLIEANVGDRLIVHFSNQMRLPSTIHWHGLTVPAHMDGSSIAQQPVHKGETFTYDFKLLEAGTFWYHPHLGANEQVEKGLYGALIVRDPEADARLGLPQQERVLILDDVLLDKDDQIQPPFLSDPLIYTEMQLNGREGNLLLVNGAPLPSVSVQNGVPQRWRLINAANSRFMRVSLPGHTLHRIGGDRGLLEQPLALYPIGSIPDPDAPNTTISDPDQNLGLLLTPGERADLVFTPQGEVGSELVLEWHDIARGRITADYDLDCNILTKIATDDGKREPLPLLRVDIQQGEAGPEYVPPASLRTLSRIEPSGLEPLLATVAHSKPDNDGHITFYLSQDRVLPVTFDLLTDASALKAAVGETRIWEVVNSTLGDLPFHTHGFSFQHIETEFIDPFASETHRVVPAVILENKDTIRVPGRPGDERSLTIVRLAVSFDEAGREGHLYASGKVPSEGHSGGWVFGSQILEQAARGMMSYLALMK